MALYIALDTLAFQSLKHGMAATDLLSSFVYRHMDFERWMPFLAGSDPLLEASVLNLFKILSMYKD